MQLRGQGPHFFRSPILDSCPEGKDTALILQRAVFSRMRDTPPMSDLVSPPDDTASR